MNKKKDKKDKKIELHSNPIISVLNMKGGVGKTTITCNLAIEFANMGYKVLVVDVDPQFNSTQALTRFFYNSLDQYFEWQKQRKTLKYIFTSNDENRGLVDNSVSNPIVNLKKENKLVKDAQSIDLIPGDLRLIVDINSNASDRLKIFFKTNHLVDKYDIILIDCPPTWGELTSVALSLSNYFIIPTNLDEFSTVGVKILTDQLKMKIDARDTPLRCLGIVYMFLAQTQSQVGIKTDQRKFHDELHKFQVGDMSSALSCDIHTFETYFYKVDQLVTRPAIYRGEENRWSREYCHKMVDLSYEVLERLNKENE
ncbi:ParA family protein [Lactobacillus crispatus]|uniref:ParA family protein n=1 Tax=Lactobacillus crispatus TaxID=47770 RepID=UPI0018A9D568|nr:ParA family protein [Lactobacillus crispatus]